MTGIKLEDKELTEFYWYSDHRWREVRCIDELLRSAKWYKTGFYGDEFILMTSVDCYGY